MGFVSIFDFINLKEGPTRLKHFFYNVVLTMEAGILMTLWYMKVLEKVSTFTLKKQKSPSKTILFKFIYSVGTDSKLKKKKSHTLDFTG